MEIEVWTIEGPDAAEIAEAIAEDRQNACTYWADKSAPNGSRAKLYLYPPEMDDSADGETPSEAAIRHYVQYKADVEKVLKDRFIGVVEKTGGSDYED